MTSKYVSINNLKIAEDLLFFINNELLKDTEISQENFWSGFDKSLHELAPKHRKLLEKRKDLKKKIEEKSIKNKGNEKNKSN